MSARAALGQRWHVAVALLVAAWVTACTSVPSPLSPSVRGSIGTPSFGVLTEASQLPAQGIGFRRLRPWANTNNGTPSLVSALTEAAAEVAKTPGAPLIVADMAGPRGGKLSGHSSHRTGRDVDLLFFFTTPAGVPVDAPGFVRVGADGLAYVGRAQGGPLFVRIDIPRSWALVKALLQQSNVEIEWIFVVRHIEALLIEYARAKGEPLELIWRAESVLQQPTDSAPHDDHFHLRVACSHDETLAGCASMGPRWPWLKPLPAWTPELDAQLTAIVNDDEGAAPVVAETSMRPLASSVSDSDSASDRLSTFDRGFNDEVSCYHLELFWDGPGRHRGDRR